MTEVTKKLERVLDHLKNHLPAPGSVMPSAIQDVPPEVVEGTRLIADYFAGLTDEIDSLLEQLEVVRNVPLLLTGLLGHDIVKGVALTFLLDRLCLAVESLRAEQMVCYAEYMRVYSAHQATASS